MQQSDTKSGMTTPFLENEPQRHRGHGGEKRRKLKLKGVIAPDLV
jgi:hypothetical protein